MSSPVVPKAVVDLLIEFGEHLIVPLAEALLRRDVGAAERHARVIAETDAGIAALKAIRDSND